VNFRITALTFISHYQGDFCSKDSSAQGLSFSMAEAENEANFQANDAAAIKPKVVEKVCCTPFRSFLLAVWQH
jgi:hypothetical protein